MASLCPVGVRLRGARCGRATGATEPVDFSSVLILAAGGMFGAAIGLARGGSPGGLAKLRFRRPELLCVALLIQLGAAVLAPDRRFIAVAASYTLVAAWLASNAHGQRGSLRRALVVLTFGWLLNVVPIALNHGMPVSRSALDSVGAPKTTSVGQGHLFKHTLAGRHTALAPLGDVIPVPPLATVVSVGDIVILVGMAMTVASAMRDEGEPGRSLPPGPSPALITNGC